jgi:predicted 3-demethylubiquinone-9 3-methyltransferase (glyoxalase superfamily)
MSFIRPGRLHLSTVPEASVTGVAMKHDIVPFLWFDTEAEAAAEFYTSVFENSRIVTVSRYTEAAPGRTGSVMTVEFELDGQRFTALNGGPQYKFTEAVSFMITCESEAELDHYWERLCDGGEPGPCGWLKDRFGLSWQVVPDGMIELFMSEDREAASRAMAAMMKMGKLDLAVVREAYEGVAAR